MRVALGMNADDWIARAGKRLSFKSIYKFYCNDSWEALQNVENYDCIGKIRKDAAVWDYMKV